MQEPEAKEIKIELVDSLFTMEVYERHVKESLSTDGNLKFEQIDDDYKKFPYTFDFTVKKIKDFQEVALFPDTENPIRATRVQFTDGMFINCTSSHQEFMRTIRLAYFTKMQEYNRYAYITQAINDLCAQEEYASMSKPRQRKKK